MNVNFFFFCDAKLSTPKSVKLVHIFQKMNKANEI